MISSAVHFDHRPAGNHFPSQPFEVSEAHPKGSEGLPDIGQYNRRFMVVGVVFGSGS